MKEFKSYFKEDIPKRIKKTAKENWYVMQKRSLEKKKLAKKDVNEDDDNFFLSNFLEAIKGGTWVCAECNINLPVFPPSDVASKFLIRSFQHHILPKSKYSKFRHDTRNIIFLCYQYGCNGHSKAESAISYPKMKVYDYCESVKKELLNT
jgi:hypothetical protein